MLNLTISFIVSFLATMFIVRVSHRHSAAADRDLSGVQKFHVRPVPRIGGVGILLGCCLAVGMLTARDVMNTNRIIATQAAVERLQEVLG